MKKDTLLLCVALAAAGISFLIYRSETARGDIPPRRFSRSGYAGTASAFGLEISPEVIKQTRRVISNTKAISSSPFKNLFLHRGLRGSISKKYSRPAIPSLFGFIDEEEEGWLLGVFLQAAHSVRACLPEEIVLPDWFLFSAINNEGRIFQEYSDFGRISDLNGYANAGLDWFSREFLLLERLGYLPPVFRNDFTASVRTNELGKPVPTADFFEVASLFKAFIAVMANRQRVMVRDCRKAGVQGRFHRDTLLFYSLSLLQCRQGVREASCEKTEKHAGAVPVYPFRKGASSQ